MELGDPDLKLAGLSLWVLGRQFPSSVDWWDGNWFNVRARVEASQAVVEAQGAIVHAGELEAFANELQALDASVIGEASLRCIEHNLSISIRGGSLGHVTVKVLITPDPMTQSHEFLFSADQTYLKHWLNGCRSILSRWPMKGSRDNP